MGDPYGIGPEIIVKALRKSSIRKQAYFKIIGDYEVYRQQGGKNYQNCSFINIKENNGGRASLLYLQTAVDLLKKKKITGLVTAPVSKEAIAKVEPSFIGHTEFLAEAFNIKNVGMFFVSDQMRVIIVTRHLPLNEVSHAVTTSEVYKTIQLTYQYLQKMFKIKNPIIAVCGLNPHAGENGKMGTEEKTKIIPALQKARRNKINVEGPFAADTLFSPDIAKHYDAIVAMYHDQGLIPIKTLCFKNLINLTIGLPFIRTSPAHGTAFDIAGQNKANSSSMEASICLCASFSNILN